MQYPSRSDLSECASVLQHTSAVVLCRGSSISSRLYTTTNVQSNMFSLLLSELGNFRYRFVRTERYEY